jgi:hypothetical protein
MLKIIRTHTHKREEEIIKMDGIDRVNRVRSGGREGGRATSSYSGNTAETK